MRIYNIYILTVAVLLLLTTVILTALGNRAISVYYTVFILEALVVTELFVYFNARARRGLNLASVVLFGGLSVIVGLQIIRILT